MPIQIGLVSPFASFIVAYAKDRVPNAAGLIAQLKAAIQPQSGSWVADVDLTPSTTNTFAFHLTEDRTVSWAGNQLADRINHLLAGFISGRFAAIYISDANLKSAIHDALVNNNIGGWEPVDETILVEAYVSGAHLRTLWLGGTHRNVTIKPNSKIISGDNLADAIDPLGDSTFVAGAVRSSKAGISLKRSGVWFGPKNDWNSFSSCAQTLLQNLTNARNSTTLTTSIVHPGLARIIENFANVGPAYHVEWAAPETLSGVSRSRQLESLRDQYSISLGTQACLAKDISLDIFYPHSGTPESVILKPTISSKRVAFKVIGRKSRIRPWVDAIEKDAELLRVFYDSGHTIANATLTHASIQDRDFTLDFLDFTPNGQTYRVDQEKPPGSPPPLADMFKASDKSLFKWVFKEGLDQMRLPQPQPGICWLYCDDRSGEVADFIHVYKPYTGVPKISLIHVKGANNNALTRQVSPGAYELVTAQAMKNLRRIISSELLPAISNCVANHGAQRVWDQPWAIGLTSGATTSADFINALSLITSNCDHEVIIVQPQVLRSKYMPQNVQLNSAGAKQLRSLLFGARAMALTASANFRVVADQR